MFIGFRIDFVLIETLWNVKFHVSIHRIFQSTVLIETLWNVKLFDSYFLWLRFKSINRNIVECKA